MWYNVVYQEAGVVPITSLLIGLALQDAFERQASRLQCLWLAIVLF